MSTFKDNFSKHSDIYVKYRPHYPKDLYTYLSSLTNSHRLAWDCGTGNGQAAIGLAVFYDQVIATDPSEQQIKNCIPNRKVNYLVEEAESSSLQSNSVDLLTIANALHWFDFDLFYKEANRVLKPGAHIAAWTYRMQEVSHEIDTVVRQFHDEVIDKYWQPENRLVEKGYATIPFPFERIESPAFATEKFMNLTDFIGFINTWSATQRFISQNNFNPAEKLERDLLGVWKNSSLERKVTWKLVLKIGEKGMLKIYTGAAL